MHSQLIPPCGREYSPIYFFRWKLRFHFLIRKGSWPILEFRLTMIVFGEACCGNWKNRKLWVSLLWEEKTPNELPSFSGLGAKAMMSVGVYEKELILIQFMFVKIQLLKIISSFALGDYPLSHRLIFISKKHSDAGKSIDMEKAIVESSIGIGIQGSSR